MRKVECFDLKGNHCEENNPYCVAKSTTIIHHITKQPVTKYYAKICRYGNDAGALYDPGVDFKDDLLKRVSHLGCKLFEFEPINEAAYIDYVMFIHAPHNRARLRAAQEHITNG